MTAGVLGKRIRVLRRYRYLYLMAVPVVLFYALFHYAPMYGLIIAFKDYNVFKGILGSPWVGLYNFELVFGDNYFWKVVRNTAIISLLKLVFGFPAPIIIALLLNEVLHMGFKRVIQTIIYLPRFISWVILAGIMINILSIHGGLVNQIVELFGGTPQSYLMKPDYFRPIVTISHIWKTAGWGSIIYLAALAGINVELYESAVIDGAGKLRQTWHVTLPGIRPAIILLLILSLADIMNAGFDQIFVLYNSLTQEVGDIIDTYVYRQGLQAARYSYATVVGIFKSVIRPGPDLRGRPAVQGPGRGRPDMIQTVTLGQRLFRAGNVVFLLLFAFLTLYPFWYVMVGSMVPFSYYSTHTLLLWPGELSFLGYKTIFSSPTIPNAYKVTVFVTVVGTLLSMTVTCLAAYVTSERALPGRNLLMSLIIFTMLFNGGLIPTYLIYRSLGLIDTLWVYIAPHLVTTFYLLILKTNFQGVPQDLKDAAIIDGCNEFSVLFRVMIPLSMPVLATITLFYTVDRWNDLFTAIFFIVDSKKFSLQAVLYFMISRAGAESIPGENRELTLAGEQIKLAAIMAATIPVLLVYPFLQRYFVKGVLIGAIKG